MNTKNIVLLTASIIIITSISFAVVTAAKIKKDEKNLAKKAAQTKVHISKPRKYVSPINTYAVSNNTSAKSTSGSKPKTKLALPEKPIAKQPENLKKADGLFSTDYLKMQEFTINTKRDTQIVAEGGMKVTIPANAFTYKNGKAIDGNITVQVKEAFKPEDIILANLVTKKGEEFLESGGMYYLNACLNKEDLKVAKDKHLTIEMPTPNIVKGMELYEGVSKAGKLDWANAVKLNKNEELMDEVLVDAKENFDISFDAKVKEGKYKMISENGKTQVVEKTSVKAKTKTNGVIAVSYDTLGWVNRDWKGGISGSFNEMKKDNTLSYIVETQRMGWANIDCIYHDPRSRQISFVTEVTNNTTFEDLAISLMFKTRRVCIPGYQMANGTYSFTHGDYEPPSMPIGEKAFVIVSAKRNGEQYFDIKEVIISDNTYVNLEPVASDLKTIKEKVKLAM